MYLAFDIQFLLKSQKTGIGYYSENLILGLMKEFPRNSYTFCFFASRRDNMHLVEKYRALSGSFQSCMWFSDKLYRMLWGFIPVPFRWFFSEKKQITHFLNFLVPPGVQGKTVVTVHDMCYKACPETVRGKTKYLLELNLKRSCRRADKIITISQFSKQEMIKYLGISPEKIVVVPCGVDLQKFNPAYSAEAVKNMKQKYNLPDTYFLYLGTIEPRKNIKRLIEAYHRLLEQCPLAPCLVMAGGKGWLYDDLGQFIKKLGLHNKLIFTGYVAPDDLPLLLKGAMVFVFPSLYEGFGMPPLEAMACGTPVLTSNVSSLPEVVGDCAITVNPYSVDEIIVGMRQLMEDEQLRKELAQKGLVRAQSFTWERVAEETMKVYEDLLAEESS